MQQIEKLSHGEISILGREGRLGQADDGSKGNEGGKRSRASVGRGLGRYWDAVGEERLTQRKRRSAEVAESWKALPRVGLVLRHCRAA
jgi:hypothetical protein